MGKISTSNISKEEKKVIHQIDYAGHPKLSFEELLELYGPHVILNLDEVLSNKTTWAVTYQNLWDIIKYGYEYPEIRNRIIHFKIHSDDRKVHSLQLKHFISNMVMWHAFAATDSADIMDESYIYNFLGKSMEEIVDYYDEMYVGKIQIDSDTMSTIIDEWVYNVTTIAKYCSILAGGGLSVLNIIKTAEKYPEMREIMCTKAPESLQPHELEVYLKEKTERLVDIIKNSDCDLAPIFNAGKIMSMGQFQEVMVMIGYKGDLYGNVIPYPIRANIFVDGYMKPSYFIIDAKGGRKAQVDQKINMTDPGVHAKRVSNNTASIMLKNDYDMCDTTKFVTYGIKDATWLTLLNGRYYYDDMDLDEKNKPKLKCVDYKKDKHLIGRELKFRSPCTCNAKDGYICKYCYGELFDNNKGLASAGAYAGIVETEPLKQRTLKTKHVNQTDSEIIAFNEEFNRDFEFLGTDIVLKDVTDADETTESKYLKIDEIFKEDQDDTPVYYCKRYSIVDAKEHVIYNVEPTQEIKMYFSKSLMTLLRKSKSKDMLLLSYDDIDPSDCIFTVDVSTTDNSDSVARIKSLINTKSACANTTIDELCNNMLEAKIESKIFIDAVHDEMVIRGLIRKRSNIYEQPDFGPNGDPDDYTILSLGDSLYNSPSPLESLRQTNLRRQLLDPRFMKKHAPSPVDPLFAPILADVLPDDHPSVDRR